ncbi:ABC transporter substrate-binding protein [Limnochorda pilosa]|uniref:Sugar ABC transporter substrate-binding protein n=1 Tax=Limnochorda pilosa TaxID=1555112 RepID=A0A0K2SLZ7_LIMPI|nr:sugar ABC transporter substrate-binding protein [Limnochorda pilosa]BAS28125.1 hypothetical protein LIP_2284 [Limnochorda pilosa]
MRAFRYLAVALVLLLMVTALTPSTSAQSPVRLRFVSLAWQEDAIAAVKELVQAWNSTHPTIQVEYQQVDWSSIHDYLVTSFQTGDVPDIFHYESPQVLDFGRMGYLTDLAPLMSDDLRNDVLPNFWRTVSVDNAVYGVPYIVEPFVILYNQDLFEEAGIQVDPSQAVTWEGLREMGRQLTKDVNGDGRIDQYGAGLALRNPANRILNLSMAFGGQFFYQEDGRWVIRVGENELALARTLHDMMYVDESLAKDGVGLSSSELMAGFIQGRYAMIPGVGAFTRHDLAALASETFRWGVLPHPRATTARQGAVSQTLSIPAASRHPREAMQFVEFLMNTENMAKLAHSDWLLPTRKSSLGLSIFTTEEYGWDVVSASAVNLAMANWQIVPGYEEVRSKVLNPLLQEYFYDRITEEQLAQRIELEGNRILERYR